MVTTNVIIIAITNEATVSNGYNKYNDNNSMNNEATISNGYNRCNNNSNYL